MILLNKRQQLKKDFFYSSTFLLIFLLIVKLLATLFALLVYAKVTPLRDAERYLSANLLSWDFSFLFNRTLITEFIYAFLKQFLIFNALVHLFISTLVAVLLWYILKPEYAFINKPLLILCLCLPHFLIWSGVVGKEILAITGFLLIIKACVDLAVWQKIKIIPLVIGVFLALIERPHYAMAYFYLFFITLVIVKSNIKFMGLFSPLKSTLLLMIVTGYLGLVYYYLYSMFANSFLEFMFKVQHYFRESNNNRWGVSWDQTCDFFYNFFWGGPISIIGATYFEALNRPILIPIFIEGCLAIFLLGYILYALIRLLIKSQNYTSLLIWGIIPSLGLGVLINYPLGLFNTGSAIRYKQSLAPLLYFYPLLLMGAIQRKRAQHFNK